MQGGARGDDAVEAALCSAEVAAYGKVEAGKWASRCRLRADNSSGRRHVSTTEPPIE
jgi:hypothetical protein